MPNLRMHLHTEDGSALMISFFILLAVLAFSGATFEAAVILSNSTNRETNAQQAFQAADSGIDTAIHRLAIFAPTSTQCMTNTVQSSCPSGWGPTSASETVGSNASFTYQVSTQNPAPTCVGTAMPGGLDRCIVATGTANGVTRRIMARVTTRGGANSQIFLPGGTQAVDSIKVESGVTITSDMVVNNKLEVSHNSTISGTVTVGPKAKVKGWSTYSCTTAVPPATQKTPPNCDTVPVGKAPPDFGTTATAYDAVTNLGGNNNSTISSTYYNATTRTLSVPKNKQVTLAPGVYNFCTIKIDGHGILNTGGTAANPVKIYLDSPFRTDPSPGSGCPRNSGNITAGGKGVIVNPSLDPTALAIIAWGSTSRKKRARLQIPLGKAGVLAAVIYAPQSEVRFGDDKGTLIGGIVGRRIVFKRNMRFISDNRVTSWSTSTISQSFRVAWKQCDSTIVNPATPSTGC
jgi:Tfp pilus assembly protein PilX